MASVLTYGGLAIITGLMKGSGTEPKNIRWGSGTGTVARNLTDLFTEEAETSADQASSQDTIAQTNDTYKVVGTLEAAGAKTITNAGLKNDAGTLFQMFDFTGISLGAGNTIVFTFKCQFL